jgi:hypothetical protein
LWWTKTQKEHYHQKNYYVSALLAEDKGELKRFHPAMAGLSAARPMNVEILVFEHNEMQSDEKEQCILTYDLNEELAAEILTDEAIQTFEDDERDAKHVWSSSSHQHQSQQDADADDDQVWNYWSHPHDYNDYAAQAMS